jgi:hypothetical protein
MGPPGGVGISRDEPGGELPPPNEFAVDIDAAPNPPETGFSVLDS